MSAPRGRPATHILQRRLCEAIIGKEGTKEYKEFCETTRRHLLAGILPPAITQLILHYGYGKPVEEVEIVEKTIDISMAHLTEQQLRERATRLAMARYIAPAGEDIETKAIEAGDPSETEATPSEDEPTPLRELSPEELEVVRAKAKVAEAEARAAAIEEQQYLPRNPVPWGKKMAQTPTGKAVGL